MPQPQSLNIDPNDAAAAAEEEAAFASVQSDGEEQAAPVREQPTEGAPAAGTEDEQQPAASAAPAAPEVVDPPWKAELSALREANEKNLREVYGKLGGEVGNLRKQLQQSRRPAGKVTIPETGFKRLGEEFPELSKSLREDLEEVLSSGLVVEGPEAPDLTEKFESYTKETLSQVDQRVEERLLRRDHKDWKDVVSSDDFKSWVTTVLPEAEAKMLDDSWDADFISTKLTEFKTWKASKQAQTTSRAQRLEQAIAPSRGAPAAQVEDDSEEAAFLAGFNG